MNRIPADQRRALLVQAALRVIAKQGVSGATTRAIVAEAGMSLASFHYAFRSHDEMMRELVAYVVDAESMASFAALRSAPNDIPGRVSGCTVWPAARRSAATGPHESPSSQKPGMSTSSMPQTLRSTTVTPHLLQSGRSSGTVDPLSAAPPKSLTSRSAP